MEAGYEQIVRPTGGSLCCRYTDNAMDQLYLAPFGVRVSGQARFYYLDIARYERGRLFTVGPVLRFRLK